MRLCDVAFSALLLWTARIEASRASYYGIDYNAKAAYFNFDPDLNSQYVFALNAVENGDIYFHMSGPVNHTWLGMGIGSVMKDSFMIIAYPSANGLETTISTRIATGHTEPVYAPGIEIIKIYNDTYAPNANTVTERGKGVIIAHAMCRNCSQWVSGKLDTRSTQQPFIFALGPSHEFRSDSVEASIPRHVQYGWYTMDMTQATNYSGWYGRVPAPNVPHFSFPPNDTAFATSGASFDTSDVFTMGDPLPGVHAALMCVAFVLIFPFGAVVMQFLKRALVHAAVQVIGLVAVLAGFGVAIKIAREYNKSKNFTSGHQIIGLIIIAGLFIQLGLGLVHHSMYMRTNKPTPMGRIHFFLGPFIMLLGLINGGVGFNFAGRSDLALPYGIVVAALALVFFGIIGCQLWCRSRRKYRPEPGGFQYPQFGQPGYHDYEMSRQNTFGEQPPEPYEPTTPYTPIGPYSLTTPISPYTPISAYTPVTPNTWKKEEITNWPRAPYKEFD